MGRGAAKDGREAWAEGPETTSVQLWWTHCDTDKRRLVEWTVLPGRACWAGGTRVRGGGRVGRTLLAEAGLRVWASKPGAEFTRRTRWTRDGTWRHPEACVETKLRMRRARDRRIMKTPDCTTMS